MLRNVKAHEIIISLLKNCGYKINSYKLNQKLTQHENLTVKLFSKCYKFLEVFI